MFDDQYMKYNMWADLDAEVRIGIWSKPIEGSDAPDGSGILNVNGNRFQLHDKNIVEAMVDALGGDP